MWPKAVHFSQDDILLILVEITVQCHPIIYESKTYEVQKSIPEFFYSYAFIHLADIAGIPTLYRY